MKKLVNFAKTVKCAHPVVIIVSSRILQILKNALSSKRGSVMMTSGVYVQSAAGESKK